MRSYCREQVNFALEQVKMEVWWASEISLRSLVSDNFRPKTISKFKDVCAKIFQTIIFFLTVVR